MLIALCSLLAASPVSASLLPQSSAVHLLDTAADRSAGDWGEETLPMTVPRAPRILAEAASGGLLGIGGGLVGIFAGGRMAGSAGGYSALAGPVLGGFIGFELGEIAGVALAGLGLGARGSIWTVVLGHAAGLAAAFLLAPLWILPPVGIAALALLPLAGGIAMLEAFADGPSDPPSRRTSAALTIHF